MFLYPEKPMQIHDIDFVPKNYIAQIKKDGHRAIIEIDNIVKVYNRNGDILNASKKYDWSWLNKVFPNKTLLDGELVGIRQAKELSDTIVIWDAPIYDGVSLKNNSYIERWNVLNSLVCKKQQVTKKSYGCSFIAEFDGMKLFLSHNFPINLAKAIIQKLDAHFDEGIVFKNPDSKLEWSKIKTVTTTNQLKYKIK